jgi:hypothetical protein
MDKHRDKLNKNPRVHDILRTWDKKHLAEKEAVLRSARYTPVGSRSRATGVARQRKMATDPPVQRTPESPRTPDRAERAERMGVRTARCEMNGAGTAKIADNHSAYQTAGVRSRRSRLFRRSAGWCVLRACGIRTKV